MGDILDDILPEIDGVDSIENVIRESEPELRSVPYGDPSFTHTAAFRCCVLNPRQREIQIRTFENILEVQRNLAGHSDVFVLTDDERMRGCSSVLPADADISAWTVTLVFSFTPDFKRVSQPVNFVDRLFAHVMFPGFSEFAEKYKIIDRRTGSAWTMRAPSPFWMLSLKQERPDFAEIYKFLKIFFKPDVIASGFMEFAGDKFMDACRKRIREYLATERQIAIFPLEEIYGGSLDPDAAYKETGCEITVTTTDFERFGNVIGEEEKEGVRLMFPKQYRTLVGKDVDGAVTAVIFGGFTFGGKKVVTVWMKFGKDGKPAKTLNSILGRPLGEKETAELEKEIHGLYVRLTRN